jgi:hypothetical protein
MSLTLSGTREKDIPEERSSLPCRTRLFTKLDSPISLAFLERYPSPADVRGLGEQRLGAFLARQHYSGGRKPAELPAKLKQAPQGRVGKAELAARRALVLALVAAIRPLVEQIKDLTEQIATALRGYPTARSSCRCSATRAAW